MKQEGYFTNREYVITEMHPVRPLKNYFWSDKTVGFADQTLRGNTLACINTVRRRFIKSERIFYIKDLENGKVYSPNRNFEDLRFSEYECHVGLGYQTLVSKYRGLAVKITVTVPTEDYAEIVKVTVKNTGKKPRRLDGYYYTDIDANLTVHWAYGKGYYDEDFGGILYPHDHFQKTDEYNTMFAKGSLPVKGYAVSEDDFFGVYGNKVFPEGIRRDTLPSEGTVFEENYCAAFQFELSLAPGQSRDYVFIAGVAQTPEEAQAVSDKYLSGEKFDEEIKRQKETAEQYIDTFTCRTPDAYFDIMANVWTKRQLSLGKTWGRVYGKGFRDVMQDIAAFVSLDPALARKQILYAMSHQYESGNAIRMYEPDFTYPYYDMPVWIFETVGQYIKESGDILILEEPVQYLDSDLSETLFDHLKRGMKFLLTNRGKHDLVLWGGGDWNDSMNNAGMKLIGESVWLSIATVKALNEFIELLSFLHEKDDLIRYYLEEKDRLENAIEKHGYEKDHYIYGYADNGQKVGSYEANEGKIYLNPQTWAVLAHLKHGEKALDTAEKLLRCDYGYLQNRPAYTKGIEALGRSTYFILGLIENASVYNHGVAFKIVADVVLGRNDAAYETFRMMRYDNPKHSDSGVEPYAFSNMYIGPDSPFKQGFAPMSWITGTAGWMYRAMTEKILGVYASYHGLVCDPHIPSEWDAIEISRKYRGCTYHISIVRDKEKDGLYVNGKKAASDVLPIGKEGERFDCVRYVR